MYQPITAATVRAYFAERPERVATLSEAAQHTLREGARGRLHPEVVKAYNAKRKQDLRYVLGATKAAAASRASQRAALVEQGLAKAKGRLSKEALASLSK